MLGGGLKAIARRRGDTADVDVDADADVALKGEGCVVGKVGEMGKVIQVMKKIRRRVTQKSNRMKFEILKRSLIFI